MIRFRLGQAWKRERSAAPVDAFGMELEGVELLPQASEESLEHVVPELLEAIHQLTVRGTLLAQASLPEAHTELCFQRAGSDVEVAVAALSRPARLLRRFAVDALELRQAAVGCARAFTADLAERLPARAQRFRQKWGRKLVALEHAPLPQAPAHEEPGFSYQAAASGPCGFGFSIWDPQDRVRGFRAQASGALASLLCEGEVWLRAGDAVAWRLRAPPVLTAVELSRQAAELAHALEAREAGLQFRLAGSGPELSLGREQGALAVDLGGVKVRGAALANAMCELGLGLALAVSTRHRAQARNPYVTDLSERCRDTLARLKDAPAPEAGRVARAARPRRKGKPLSSAGRLRRIRLELQWQKQSLGGETPGQILLGQRGPVFASPEMACGFTPKGELLFRRTATRGIAADGAGHVLCTFEQRVVGYAGPGPSARWLRSHDALPLGPELWARDGMWITLSEGRAVIAFDEMSGRELWRLAPPRTQRCFVALQAHRALVTTDSGYLYGLDLADGQVRYRMKASLPFAGPMIPWGLRSVGALGRGETATIFVVDAHRGPVMSKVGEPYVLWAYEMHAPLASDPLPAHARVYVAAGVEGGALVCLASKGERAWERPLHLGPGPYALAAVGRAVVVTSRAGAAALVDSDGRILWRVGDAGERLAWTLMPQRSRGVLLVPGATVRAVDPASGEVLGEVEGGSGLCDLVADARFNLYLLDDQGTLRAFRPSTHLSVVAS